MDSDYVHNKTEFNLTNEQILNDSLIATLNRKNLNPLNAQFEEIDLDKSKLSIDSIDLLKACQTGYNSKMYKTTNRQNGVTEILLHHSQQQHTSSTNKKSTGGGMANNTNVKHSTLPKTSSQLNQTLNLPKDLIDENVRCSTLIKWLCSPPLLCALLLGYACFGALLFHHLESGAETLSRVNVIALRNNTLQRLWNITLTLNLLYPRAWNTNATNELINFERALIYMVRTHGYNGFTDTNQPNSLALHDSTHDDRVEQWTLSGALLYSLTIISTIGKLVIYFFNYLGLL